MGPQLPGRTARRMKLACSSAAFDPALVAGELTQLEWLDRCGTELNVDGVVFEAQHFPRTDADYVAQLKKMATDLGLTVAGLACDELLAGAQGASGTATDWIGVGAGLGAPIVITRTPTATDTAEGWNRLVADAKGAAGEAKRRNVTLAVRNAPSTLCVATGDLKRLAKDVDSAWLRFGLDTAALDPPEPLEDVLLKTVVATHRLTAESWPLEEQRLAATEQALATFRGFLVLEATGRDALHTLGAALDRLRAGPRPSATRGQIAL
jgi:hypothetical protein